MLSREIKLHCSLIPLENPINLKISNLSANFHRLKEHNPSSNGGISISPISLHKEHKEQPQQKHRLQSNNNPNHKVINNLIYS
jgi:hypothetical protein